MKLAVFFPGIGYHTDKPLLYYSRKIAVELGYQTVEVKYGNFGAGIKGSREKMEKAFVSALAQAEEILEDIDFEDFEEILFVSKSVGTAVASAYAEKRGLQVRNIYYTPVEASFSFMKQYGIVFHGTNDGWVDTEIVRTKCEEKGFPLYITENANHSLEMGETLADLANMKEIMRITREYMKASDKA